MMARQLIWALVAMLSLTCGAQAAPILFTAQLSGPAEEPSNTSPGTGFALVEFDLAAHTLSVEATFENLLGPTTAAHIHAPTPLPFTGVASVATQTPSFLNFPLGVTSGTFSQLLMTDQVSTFRAGFITDNGGTAASAEAALHAFLLEGRAYFNIHSSVFPGGEIRGFLVQVPEPGTIGIFGLSSVGLLLARRRRRDRAVAT